MNKIKQFFTNLFNRDEKPEFNVGDEVTYISGRYYHDSNGGLPYGFKRRGKNVFVTKVNLLGTHPYHISTGNELGDGDLGWLKAEQIESV